MLDCIDRDGRHVVIETDTGVEIGCGPTVAHAWMSAADSLFRTVKMIERLTDIGSAEYVAAASS